MRNFLLGLVVAAGIAVVVAGQRRREAEAAAEAWASQTDPID